MRELAGDVLVTFSNIRLYIKARVYFFPWIKDVVWIKEVFNAGKYCQYLFVK